MSALAFEVSRMTDLDLAAIRQRVGKATEGPWEETWRPIPGFDGYEVSDFGNVRSYWAKGNHLTKRRPAPRTLAKRSRKDGKYPSVSLPKPGGGYSSRRIHRLVLLAFEGPCPGGMEVAHLNGDASDNRLVNLAYVTHQENEDHKRTHGTHSAGEGNSQAKLQGWQVSEIRYLAGKSVPQGQIADLFGVSHKQISDILRGRTWSDQPARTDIPALLAGIDRLNATIQRVREDAISWVGKAWDDGNATGLDGWVGPGRGTLPIDREAQHARTRMVHKADRALEGGEQ